MSERFTNSHIGTAARSQNAGHTVAHYALFYRDDAEYLEGVHGFVAPGLREGEPIAIAVPGSRAPLLRERLGENPDVEFLDMEEVGRNPARIIPLVATMLAKHGRRTLHWVGEPIWPGRSPAEMREATRHEALINLAWRGASIRGLCPYNASALDFRILADARSTHPWVIQDGQLRHSSSFSGPTVPSACDERLSEPPPGAEAADFEVSALGELRATIARRAAAAGLSEERTRDLVLAVNEVATNTIRHAGGAARLRLWSENDDLVCQLEDTGYIADPLAGRRVPSPDAVGGIGLWMVHQLCDLVEVRTAQGATIIRLHVSVN